MGDEKTMRETGESLGDVLVSREDLRTAANIAIGGAQALVGFLRDRDDMSREHLADMLEGDWRALNSAVEATPSIYYAGMRPGDSQKKEEAGRGGSGTTERNTMQTDKDSEATVGVEVPEEPCECRGLGYVLESRSDDQQTLELIRCPVPDCEASGREIVPVGRLAHADKLRAAISEEVEWLHRPGADPFAKVVANRLNAILSADRRREEKEA